MTLYEYTKNEIQKGAELFLEEQIIIGKRGATLRRDTHILRQLCLGAISTDNSREWYMICRLHCPVGTIIEDYDETKWNPLYEEYVAMCRLELTKAMMTERNTKSAAILMKVLEKRDKEHWGDAKTVDVKTNGNEQAISINIVSV